MILSCIQEVSGLNPSHRTDHLDQGFPQILHIDRANSMQGRDEKSIKNVVRNHVGKDAFGRPRHRWKGDIKIDLTVTKWIGFILHRICSSGTLL